jgi:TAT (twin-arginine translocation) pathway signal sequence
MGKVSRRDLLKAGAGGAAAGLLVMGAPRAAGADNEDAFFVHIDGVVEGKAGTFKIDIDVSGTADKLRGEGWDTDPDEDPQNFCIYVQSGRIRDKTVQLHGKVQLANDPANLGLLVTTKINTKTGRIVWTFGPFEFTGEGRAIVAAATRKPQGGD